MKEQVEGDVTFHPLAPRWGRVKSGAQLANGCRVSHNRKHSHAGKANFSRSISPDNAFKLGLIRIVISFAGYYTEASHAGSYSVVSRRQGRGEGTRRVTNPPTPNWSLVSSCRFIRDSLSLSLSLR